MNRSSDADITQVVDLGVSEAAFGYWSVRIAAHEINLIDNGCLDYELPVCIRESLFAFCGHYIVTGGVYHQSSLCFHRCSLILRLHLIMITSHTQRSKQPTFLAVKHHLSLRWADRIFFCWVQLLPLILAVIYRLQSTVGEKILFIVLMSVFNRVGFMRVFERVLMHRLVTFICIQFLHLNFLLLTIIIFWPLKIIYNISAFHRILFILSKSLAKTLILSLISVCLTTRFSLI